MRHVWPEHLEEKETGSLWKESVPTGQARGDASAVLWVGQFWPQHAASRGAGPLGCRDEVC